MSAYLSKYNVGLNGKGYIISQRNGVRQYQKKRAPAFVNKFGGGDSSYRDATFWQYWVQTNWRNGAKQLKWDDAGKFWKSSDVDTTILEELSLSKSFSSAGQMIASGKVNAMEAWRSSVSWWNSNYGYRQQLTITNSSSSTAPVGYPVQVTIDTAALQTAGKVRSDRKDWRIIYDNGSTLTDLTRDYVSTTSTFFALQATIAAGSSSSSYYVYYGYASEATDKQPSAEADWNAVYGMYGTTPDANSVAIFHLREGTGTSVADDSSSANTASLINSPNWGTDGKLGRYISLNGSNQSMSLGNLSLGSFTMEGWVYINTFATSRQIIAQQRENGGGSSSNFSFEATGSGGSTGGLYFSGIGLTRFGADNVLGFSGWYHVAATGDGTTMKLYVNGSQISTQSNPSLTSSSEVINLGRAVESSTGSYLNGRIQHFRFSNTARTSFPYVLSSEPSISSGAEITTQPPASTFDLYGGGSDGKIYKWDGTTTWTEQFDCRRLVWYETGTDANKVVGDTGGTETAQSQGFQLPAAITVSGAQMYLKKAAGTPGNITVRIETDSTNKPSGTLANANATGTITAFTTSSYSWVEVTFTGTFSLSASTTYHLVLKTSAAANDTNYNWAADASSPSFSSGANSHSEDGGTTWTADSTTDMYFRILGQATEVNCMKVTSVGGTQKLYIGTGASTGQTNADARLYSFDGTNWALTKTFATSTESMVLSIEEYTANSKVYVGVGPQARIYESSDMSTFTLSKDINIPQNPGYPHTMKEYNRVLHVGGGSPEFLPTQFYNGFLSVYDSTAWNTLYPFDFTVIKSLEFYDAYLFMGTYRGDLYVYDTASLNPLFNFKDQYNYSVEIRAMKYYNDKLYIALSPQSGSNDTNVGIWLFDRRGLSLAHTISGVTGYRCFTVVNGLLMVGTGDNGYVYKIDLNSYATTGFYQSSYFDANLPSIDKLYNQVTLRHDPLAEGQSIVVHYKFKESDSWTLLGTSETIGGIENTLTFPTGTYSKKISLKTVLNTTNTSATPKLTETVMQYSLYPTRKWQWTLRLKAKKNLRLLDNSFESRTATEVRTDLEDLLSSQQLYLYTDIDGTTYSVLTNDVDNSSWVVNQLNGDVNEDEVIISLLEA
jgi:hypothetical protein